MPVLLDACSSSHSDLRQCAVYGVGLGAALAPAAFKPHAPAALRALQAILTAAVSVAMACVCVCVRRCACRHAWTSFIHSTITCSLARALPTTPQDAKSEENEMATDNAISAMAALLEHHRDVLDAIQVRWRCACGGRHMRWQMQLRVRGVWCVTGGADACAPQPVHADAGAADGRAAAQVGRSGVSESQ
jgi:hypothetical protein